MLTNKRRAVTSHWLQHHNLQDSFFERLKKYKFGVDSGHGGGELGIGNAGSSNIMAVCRAREGKSIGGSFINCLNV